MLLGRGGGVVQSMRSGIGNNQIKGQIYAMRCWKQGQTKANCVGAAAYKSVLEMGADAKATQMNSHHGVTKRAGVIDAQAVQQI